MPVLGHRSQLVPRVGSFLFITWDMWAKKKKQERKNPGDVSGRAGAGRAGRGGTQSTVQNGGPPEPPLWSLGPAHLSPQGTERPGWGGPEATRGTFSWSVLAQPGVGLSHKVEMSPE